MRLQKPSPTRGDTSFAKRKVIMFLLIYVQTNIYFFIHFGKNKRKGKKGKVSYINLTQEENNDIMNFYTITDTLEKNAN